MSVAAFRNSQCLSPEAEQADTHNTTKPKQMGKVCWKQPLSHQAANISLAGTKPHTRLNKQVLSLPEAPSI